MKMGFFIGIWAFSALISLGVLGFIIWAIVMVMKHFGII